MRTALVILALSTPLPAAEASEAPTLWTAEEVRWHDVPGMPGARQAPLWGDPMKGDHGVLNRWPAKATAGQRVATHDTHFVVFTGTFTIEIEGGEVSELGPGSFVRIPKGVRYSPGCEAAGECNFVMHMPGPEAAPGSAATR